MPRSYKIKKCVTSLGRWEIQDNFPLKRAEKIVITHIHNMEMGVNVIKTDYKRQLSRVIEEGESYIVKEFRRPGPWWVFRPDAISWRNAHKLKELNLPVANVYTWLKSRDRRGFIIMEDLGDNVLGDILKVLKANSYKRAFFLKKLAHLVGIIHAKRLIYGDLKLTNVMIKKDSLFLVDMDKIKQKNRLIIKDRLYNLRQIIGSFPHDMTDNEYHIFFDTYLSYIIQDEMDNLIILK